MLNRSDIQLISRNSTISENDIAKVLQTEIYNDKKSWQKFLQLFFISIGVGFTIAGVLFFFAYNWSDLHKFIKIGLVEGLLIMLTLFAVFFKIKLVFKNILLLGATMLVGVLFAVFGQIYQTGANAYDFFLGWTMAVTIWVLIANLAPLWLFFIILINVTFGLYLVQVAPDWSELLIGSIYILGNGIVLTVSLLLKIKKFHVPNWFDYLLALSIASFITVTMIIGIYGDQIYLDLVILLSLLFFVFGIFYGLKYKKSYYLSIIALSLIIIIGAGLLDFVGFRDFEILLFIGFLMVGSITLVIRMLMKLQKKWRYEK